MSGKPYTIGEFKIIVDYLVENKLYGETKARKMWVDFANTKITSRTWQSLKETFLKRILPDIHNPYFKLTNEQISSFRARCDLADRNKNKLEVHTISDDSNSNGHDQKDNEPAINEGATSAGENIKCSKIPVRSRSSADTVILENCYETAEEIQKELESADEQPTAASKSLRDCITYSEPLTPMLQEVLDDFASEPEDSDREGQMEIVENVPENENSENVQEITEAKIEVNNSENTATNVAKNGKGLSFEGAKEVLAQELDSNKPESNSPKKNTSNVTNEVEELPEVELHDEISSMQVENGTERDDDVNTQSDGGTKNNPVENSEKSVVHNSGNVETIVVHDSHSEPQEQSGQLNNSNSTVDASLPNNPEALKNKVSEKVETNNKNAPENVVEETNNSTKTLSLKKTTRKRSCSQDNANTVENKKKKLQIKSKPAKIDNMNTESHTDTNAEDKQKTNNEFVKPGVIKKPRLQETTDKNKPSTSFETHAVDLIEAEKRNNTKESPEIQNPCLQNISLFDEQFNKTKYNMSESSDTEQNKKESNVDTQEATVSKSANDVVTLKSHSDSDTVEVHASPKKKHRAGVLINKSERDKAIANMFGFSGGVGSKRRRQLSRRRRTISHNNTSHHNAAAASNSSDWTSESGSEVFVSPPRSRKNRPTRKYLKPHAARITSLEEEGGLFVMYGKKIYPLVKDGKIVKNYITYIPESDSEEGESFWKQKYVEEKKKAEELKKLLEEAKEPRQSRDSDTLAPQANPLRSSKSSPAPEPTNGVAKEPSASAANQKTEETKVNPPEKIMIKFTKNNEEVHLEGHWPQIHPVLEQVVQIFHKEVETTVNENKSKMTVVQPEPLKELSSGASTPVIITTPVDPEVHEKVNKIENEIFQEIEERDKEEEIQPNGVATNVTKRKIGKPRKSSSSSHSSEKPSKTSNGTETKASEENSRTRKQKAKDTENNNNDTQENDSKRKARTPRKYVNETVNNNETRTIQTRRSRQNLDSSNASDEDDGVRYMLPPANRRSLKSPANKRTYQKRSLENNPKILSSPDNVSLNSMDSTQGYQDTDVSLVNTGIRKKKKIDVTSFTIKTRNSLRRSAKRKPHPYLHPDAYNDSSNSSVDARVKMRDNSSLNPEAYRSESYQLLNPQAKISSAHLEPIDETSQINNETYFIKQRESICRNQIPAQTKNNKTSPISQMTSDIGSSSNVSLPMSPELSVVENLSVSKEMLQTADFPTINEMQGNEIQEATLCSNYMITDVDVSMPLMNQELEFQSYNTVTEMSTEPKSLVTESLLKKIDKFSINDQVTPTDTLNKKLHDLLLESAKKANGSQSAQKEPSMMDVDVATVEVQKKPKANKKRCSTPQKRRGSKKSVAPTVAPVVEEEHVESCSHSGRKSCPPLFHMNLRNENDAPEQINTTTANIAIEHQKPKTRKKKDIIRVKIQRPKNKKASEKLRTKSAQNASRISVFTDSGINDSESEIFFPANDSVDLIHNHSETCLHANECVSDSIEFVENSKSVITLGDSMQSGDNAWNSQCENNEEHNTSPDFFCNNAQDVSFYNKVNADSDSPGNTVYHSPLGTEASHNSLITEDLSDEVPPSSNTSKWYLLSEEETNTNLVGTGSTMLSGGNYCSNLKQLFPITCAVPDLSTITEMSKENDNSQKPTLEDLDGLTGDDFNSLSVFNSNF